MRLTAAILLTAAVLAGGCCGRKAADVPAPTGETVESQWEMRLEDGGTVLEFTGAAAVAVAPPHAGRIYILLPFGQTLAKCGLDKGRAVCDTPPGAGPLARKTAEPLARLAAEDFRGGSPRLFGAEAPAVPPTLGARGWKTSVDGQWLTYEEDGAAWRLKLKRSK